MYLVIYICICVQVCMCEFELLELISLRATQAKNNINRINKLPHFNISTCAASRVERKRVREGAVQKAARNVAAATTTGGKFILN